MSDIFEVMSKDDVMTIFNGLATPENISNLTKQLDDISIDVMNPTYGVKGDGVTDDTQAIIQAVNDAYTQNRPLNWPNATYLTTANIPYLHQVTHIGKGVIKRGSNLFYINPKGNLINTLYVSKTGGLSTNDGLDTTSSMDGLQTAFNVLPNYGDLLRGTWQIQLSGENYGAVATSLQQGLRSVNPIKVLGASVGGSPNVPTTIFDANNTSLVGIQGLYNINLYVQDILFKNYCGSTSSGGIVVSYKSSITTSNVHTYNSYYGITAEHQSALTVPDGIHDHNGFLANGSGGGAGIRSLMQSNHYVGVQNGGTTVGNAVFTNSYIGFVAQELSTGHVNYCTFTGNTDAVRLTVGSRANLQGCDFTGGNIRDLRADLNCVPYLDSTIKWSPGGTSHSSIVLQSGARAVGTQIINEFDPSYGITPVTYAYKYANQSVSSTSLTILHTSTLMAPHWAVNINPISIGKKLEVTMIGTLTGTAGKKRLVIRLKDSAGTVTNNYASVVFQATETGSFTAKGYVYFNSPTNQIMFLEGRTDLQTNHVSRMSNTCDATTNMTFTVEAYVDVNTDVILIDNFDVTEIG